MPSPLAVDTHTVFSYFTSLLFDNFFFLKKTFTKKRGKFHRNFHCLAGVHGQQQIEQKAMMKNYFANELHERYFHMSEIF